jgi:hypothetical protein
VVTVDEYIGRAVLVELELFKFERFPDIVPEVPVVRKLVELAEAV